MVSLIKLVSILVISALITALITALAALFYSRGCNTNMTQESGNGSTNYQARGDITVNTRE